MDEYNKYPTIRVKASSAHIVREHFDKIYNLFCVRVVETPPPEEYKNFPYAFFRIEADSSNQTLDQSLLDNVQGYVESCVWGGEDSSYESEDCEWGGAGGSHTEVCRTASDTLAAEYADYVDTGYQQRLEFALKLGYTEQHVQAALHKLGPNPANNELLAELIKVGAATTPPGLGGSSSEQTDWPEEEPEEQYDEASLRPIVIDGSNLAMSHGNKEVFSCRGIKLCVEWFKARGHREITVFVPKWRKEASRPNNPITGQEVLYELERERILVWTPSRLVAGKRLVCYDDRYILRLAAETGGVVVSNDNYRDLAQESPEFRTVVEQRILMYSFVNDRFMPPDDPLGRSGPTLDKFLMFGVRRAEPPCPYGRKCTYGAKCKFHHPERGTTPLKSVTERLVEHAQKQLQARSALSQQEPHRGKLLKGKSLSLPLSCESEGRQPPVKKAPLARTKSVAVSSECDTVYQGGYSGGYVRPEPRSQPPTDVSNLHRKLERQLSLNPCDPRVSQRPDHIQVARIASAPPAPAPAAPLPAQLHHARIIIHYHLASLFPEEQVLTAMNMYPTETNPQKICAAILALFPAKP